MQYNQKLITMLALIVMVMGCIAVIEGILHAIAYTFVFRKAGQAGWKAWIPYYSKYVLFKMIWTDKWFWIYLASTAASIILTGWGRNPGFFAACFLSIWLLFLYVVRNLKLAAAFGKSNLFAVGLVFLPTVFLFILAFGPSQYIGKPAPLVMFGREV